MKGIIDRFEGNYAVVELENRDMTDISKDLIPNEAKEGDSLEIRVDNGKIIEIIIDHDETSERKKRIEKMTEGLWE